MQPGTTTREGPGLHGWMESTPVRVLIADGDDAFRSLLRRLLGQTVRVVGETANGAEAVRLACRLPLEVVLLDIDLPLLDGLEAARRIKAVRPGLRVILMTGHDEEACLGATGGSGADAFLPKKLVRWELPCAIRTATAAPAEPAAPGGPARRGV